MKDLIIEKVKNIKNLNFIDIVAKKYEEEDLIREVRGLDELIELTKNKIKDAVHSALFSSFKKIIRKEFEIITKNTLQKMQSSLPEKITQKFEELKIKRFNEFEITKEIFMIIKDCFMEYIKEKDIISNSFDKIINLFISEEFKGWLFSIRNLFKNKLKDEYKDFANKLYLLKLKTYNIFGVGETLASEEEIIFNEINLEMNEGIWAEIKWYSINEATLRVGIIFTNKIYEGIEKSINKLLSKSDHKIYQKASEILEKILKNFYLNNKDKNKNNINKIDE
jgi:hypothetical protein